MKIANNLKHLVAILLVTLVANSVLAFDGYKEFKRDRWDFEASADYFQSEANYSTSGSESSLASGNSYKLMNFTVGTRYTPNRSWSVFGATNLANAEAADSVATRTNSTFTWIYGGFDFVIYSSGFDIVPEVSLLMPLQKIETSEDAALNSEGVLEARTKITLQKDFGSFLGYGNVGLTYRGDGRSLLLPWTVGGELKLKKFRLGGELFGFQSITDDEDTDSELVRNAYLNTVNAGSMAFYSVNPSIIDTNVYGKWMPNPKWTLQVGGGTTITGANSAAGFHVGALIRYSWDLVEGYIEKEAPYEPMDSPVPSGRSDMYYKEPVVSEKEIPRFREDTEDGVDQKVFKPSSPEVEDFKVELKSKKKKPKR